MADARTERLAFKEPHEFTFGTDGKGHDFITTDGKRKIACFNEALVRAFNDAKLVGVEHDYLIRTDKKGREQLEAIPGIYEKPKGGGGWSKPAGPMFTDRQVALLAANMHLLTDDPTQGSTASAHLARAEAFYAWLSGSGQRNLEQSGGAERSGGPVASTPRPAEPIAKTTIPLTGRPADLWRRIMGMCGTEESARAWVNSLLGPGAAQRMGSLPNVALDKLENEMAQS